MGGVCIPNFIFLKSGTQILSGLLEEHGADSVHVFTHISSPWAAPETASSQGIISILPQSLSSSSSSSLDLFFSHLTWFLFSFQFNIESCGTVL